MLTLTLTLKEFPVLLELGQGYRWKLGLAFGVRVTGRG